MKKQLLKIALLLPAIFLWQSTNAQYCEGGPTNTFDSNIESITLTGDGGTEINYTGCPGVAGVEDETAQVVELEAGETYTMDVQFGTCGGNFGGAGEAWIDFDQDEVFDANESIGQSSGTPGTAPWNAPVSFTFTVPLTATAGQTRIRVIQQEFGNNPLDPCANFAYGSVVDFTADIIVPAQSCPFPTNLSADVLSGSEIDLDWTPGDSETEWNVEWGAPGFTPGTGTELGSDNVTGTPELNLTGLPSSTDFEFYVQADCGGGDESFWFGPVAASTPQIAVTSYPYLEDFETGAPEWTIVNGSETNQWVVDNAVSNGGDNSLYVSNDGGTSHNYDINSASVVHAYRDFEIPSSAEEIELTFDWLSEGETVAWDRMRVWLVSTSYIPTPGTQILANGTAPTGEIQIGETNYNGNDQWLTEELEIPNAYAGETMRLVFEWRNDAFGGTQPPAAVDNVQMEIFECEAPTDFINSSVTFEGSTLFWNSSLDDFVIEYGAPGFTPGIGAGTEINLASTASPYTMTGLSPDTPYDVYIKGDCDGNATDFSNYTGPTSFTTLALCNAPTGLTATNPTTSEVDLNWTDNTGGDADEWLIIYGPAGFVLGVTGDTVVATTNPFTLTGLDQNTTYDVYVVADCDPSLSNANGPETFTTVATCIQPTDFEIEAVDTFEVEVSWTDNTGGAANDYIVEYGPAGYTFGSGTTQSVGTTSPAMITGLDPDTEYDFYIYADCGGGDVSDEDGPETATTLPLCSPVTSISVSNIGAFDAEVSWTADPGQTEWLVIYGPEGFDYGIDGDTIVTTNNPETISGLDPETEYDVYVVGECAPGDFSDEGDPETFETIPSCLPVTNLELDTVTPSTATFSWNAENGETEWNIEFGPEGFAPGSGTTVSGVTDNPYELTGLDSNTEYDFYVQAQCDPTDNSTFEGPLSFTTYATCGDTLYDTGGPGQDYLPNSNQVITICPDDPDEYIRLTFLLFDIEVNFDGMYVYDGPDINSPQIESTNGSGFGAVTTPGAFWGTDIPGPFMSTHPSGCITIQFVSDGFVQEEGFEAVVDCYDCEPTAGVDGEVDVCRLDEELDLNSFTTKGEAEDPEIEAEWTFPNNNALIFNDSLVDITSLPSGTYTAMYIVETPCAADTTFATFNVFPPSSAGDNGSITACQNEPVNLFDGLEGNVDMGGDWLDPSGNPVDGSQPRAPSLQGNYNYDYVVDNGVCPADTQFIELIVQDCDWLSLDNLDMDNIEVYPNPASELLNINNGTDMNDLKVEMFDMNGRLVLSDNQALANSSKATISIAHLEKGVYTLKVNNTEGERTFKVIKH